MQDEMQYVQTLESPLTKILSMIGHPIGLSLPKVNEYGKAEGGRDPAVVFAIRKLWRLRF
jgi:hypothetical protein